MSANCCAVDQQFDGQTARSDLARYRRRGPDGATREIIESLRARPSSGDGTLLDIGGGIGAIHHALLEHGFARAVHVDISAAYLATAQQEAERLGHRDRVTFHHGDFRTLAPTTPIASAVTLNRVVCCDPDFRSLLTVAAAHAQEALAFSYPRDRWYVRAVVATLNAWRALWRRDFRVHVHPPQAMGEVLAGAGLDRRWAGGTFVWAVELFERAR